MDGGFAERRNHSVLWRSSHQQHPCSHCCSLHQWVNLLTANVVECIIKLSSKSRLLSKQSISVPVFRFDVSRITIRLGEYTFDDDGTGHQDYKPLTIRQHQQYNTTTFVNDISIIVLPQQVVFNDDVWPVCLPPPGPLYENEEATVTGESQLNQNYFLNLMTCFHL